MVKRLMDEWSGHDLVIEKSADTFRAKGDEVYTNPGNEKNYAIDALYPDVIAKKPDGKVVIEEIETEGTVTQEECNNQWKPYSKLGYTFHLVVPENKIDVAKQLIKGLDIELQAYKITNGIVRFNLNP